MAALLLLASSRGAGAAVCGDADGDGAVTTRDGVRLLQHAAGIVAECPLAGCDVDRDGRVTTADGVLALRRAADLPIVDHCGTAMVAGRLLILPAADRVASQREHEPNDGPGTAGIAGVLTPGNTVRFTGTIDAEDSFDARVFVTDVGVTIELVLEFDTAPGSDLDLLVDDHRGGSVTCEGTMPGREHCRATIGVGEPAAFDVVVAPADGSPPAAYVLTVSSIPTRAARGVTAGPGAGVPLALDPAEYRGAEPAMIPGEIIVRLAPPTTSAERGETARRQTLASAMHAAGIGDDLVVAVASPDGSMLLTLPEAHVEAVATGGDSATMLAAKHARAAARTRTRAVAATLRASPGVHFAYPNGRVRAARIPNDPLFPQQWHLDVIGLPSAWDTTLGAPTTIVAVVDTGIRSDHPDLARRLVPGFDFITSPARANDGDGLDPDPFDPGDQPLTPAGGSYHGTHVAGTIAAATDNGNGVAGVTWRTAIMPLRVLGIGGGSIFDVAQAIRYAARLTNASGTLPRDRARIINLSLTTSGNDPLLRSAVDAATEAGVLVIAAAGNSGQNGFVSPGGFPNVLSVAATERFGARARYSTFGVTVDLAAPGGDTHRDRDADDRPDGILSTHIPGRDDYALLQGTSMAAAHVSGVAALLAGMPDGARASAPQLRAVLLETADDLGAPGRDDDYGAGLVDAARAVHMLAGESPSPDAQLVLEAAAVRIATDEGAPRVPFRNDGGGALVIAGVTADTDDGVPWLAPTIESGALRVSVDRGTLGAGNHTGRVHLESNGGAADLEVLLEVAAGPPADLGSVAVLLRDAETRAVIASTVTSAAAEYRYRFDAVAPGRYEIIGTTDRDGDGAVCDVGESCGAYPERSAPTILTVFGGAALEAKDFGLELRLSSLDAAP